MCGIFGWLWHTPPKTQQALCFSTLLAVQNDNRGGHAWGFALPDGQIEKGLDTYLASGIVGSLGQFPILMGHTRFATTGSHSIENAHPFKFGSIIGAHNGGVWNHEELDSRYGREFDVDSMHIFAHLAEGKSLYKELSGYGAIEFVDTAKPGTIYLAVSDGELSVYRVKGHGYAWSSDDGHLQIALGAAGLTGVECQIKEGLIYALTPKAIYRTKQDFVFSSKVPRYDASTYSFSKKKNKWAKGDATNPEISFKPTVRKASGVGVTYVYGSGSPTSKYKCCLCQLEYPPSVMSCTRNTCYGAPVTINGNRPDDKYSVWMHTYRHLLDKKPEGTRSGEVDKTTEKVDKTTEKVDKTTEKVDAVAGVVEVPSDTVLFRELFSCPSCGSSDLEDLSCVICDHCVTCCGTKIASRDEHAAACQSKEDFGGDASKYLPRKEIVRIAREVVNHPGQQDNYLESRLLHGRDQTECRLCDLRTQYTCETCGCCALCCEELNCAGSNLFYGG